MDVRARERRYMILVRGASFLLVISRRTVLCVYCNLMTVCDTYIE